MTKLTFFSPPPHWKYGDFGLFLSQKISFVHTQMSALFLFLWSPIDKNWLPKKKALKFGSHSTHRRRSWDVQGIYAFNVSGEHPKVDVIH